MSTDETCRVCHARTAGPEGLCLEHAPRPGWNASEVALLQLTLDALKAEHAECYTPEERHHAGVAWTALKAERDALRHALEEVKTALGPDWKEWNTTLSLAQNITNLRLHADRLEALEFDVQEAVSDQADASIGPGAFKIRQQYVAGMEAVGQTVVPKVELERLQAYHANASEIFKALRAVFQMGPNDGLMEVVLKSQAERVENAVNYRIAKGQRDGLEATLADAKKAQEFAEGITEMYANAWERELGPPYRAKTHRIDALVLTTQDRLAELKRLRLALAGIIEIGKRDMTNPKYDAYFEEARKALENK